MEAEEVSIFRVTKNKDNPYLMMNKHGVENPDLSWKAKGILAYLLSLPDDWQIYEKELVEHAADGKDSLGSGIQELIKAGYIERKRRRNEKGQLKDYEYRVYEVPAYTGFSKVGKTKVGKTATTNMDLTNINLTYSKVQGILPEGENSYLHSFHEVVNSEWNQEQVKAVKHYLNVYKIVCKKEHPKLTREQWEKVFDSRLGSSLNEYDEAFEIDLESEINMINQHFITKYKNGCDYNILHYISGNIRTMRMYEVAVDF